MKSCVLLLRILPFLLLLTSAPAAEETAAPAPTPSTAKVVDLRVESQTNPTALNTPLPRFSWRIETEERGWLQKSYHILVASTPELLAEGKGDLWDSGQVTSRSSQFISFEGPPLQTGRKLHWKARITDRNGKLTEWSEPATATLRLSGPEPLSLPFFQQGAPRLSAFECSDSALNEIYAAAADRLHEIASLRDLGLAGRSAGYHFAMNPRGRTLATHLHHSVDAAGFYPGNLPADGSFGSTRSDAAVVFTYAYWWMSGDNAFLERYWPVVNAYGIARIAADPNAEGWAFGTLPSDTLPEGDPTPPGFVHLTSEALNLRLTLGLGKQSSRNGFEIRAFNHRVETLGTQFRKNHFNEDGSLKYRSITAHLLALRCGLLEDGAQKVKVGHGLLELLDQQTVLSPFEQSPFAAANILPVLSWLGHHDKAISLVKAQDPKALSPVALAAISEWLVSMQAGIDSELPGFQSIRVQPRLPDPNLLSFTKAHFDTPYGQITTHTWQEDGATHFELGIPANTTALIQLPLIEDLKLTEDGKDVDGNFPGFNRIGDVANFRCLSGSYHFVLGK